MKLIITLLFVNIVLSAQDTIYFNDSLDAVEFSDSINTANGYPRQDANRFQGEHYDTLNTIFYHLINKVSEKGLSESDSAWKPMIPVDVGDTLWHNSIAYKARQKHFTTKGWEPPNVLALWLRIATDSLWNAGIQYTITVDTVWYNDVSYVCIQSHVSQIGWEPPNVPALWGEIIPPSVDCEDWVQPTIPDTYYHTGDCAKFGGVEYLSTIDNNVWSLAAFPAGWELKE